MKTLDLDCAAPDEVAGILRAAADRYAESVGDLSSAWGDPNAGKVWGDIARILKRTAVSCDKAVAKRIG